MPATLSHPGLSENLELFRFGGSTFDFAKDGVRLGKQLRHVLAALLADPAYWWTLAELSLVTRYPEASVSARIRDCRKLGFTVPRRRANGKGTWEYNIGEYGE